MAFNRNNNEKKESIFDESPYMKQIAFFGFYLIFFIVLILLLRGNYKQNSKTTNPKNTGYGYDYRLDRVDNENFHFVYTENLNGTNTIYDGDRLYKKASFKKSGTTSIEYYEDNDEFYLKDPNSLSWSKTENPMIFSKIVKLATLKNIITRGTYISKTEYVTNKDRAFTYQITNKDLEKILVTNNQTEQEKPTNSNSNDELLNNIIVTIDENSKLKKIELNLSNYYNVQNPSVINYNLSLTYSKYDEIEEISNPLD